MNDSKTIITGLITLLFNILAAADVINVDLDTQMAIAAGGIALAQVFQRLGTKKAQNAAEAAARAAGAPTPPHSL